MGIGEILDTSFRVYRQRFGVFFGTAAVVALPYRLVVLGLSMRFGSGEVALGAWAQYVGRFPAGDDPSALDVADGMATGGMGPSMAVVAVMLLISLVYTFLAAPAVHGAIVRVAADALAARPGGVGIAYRAAFGRLGRLVLTMLLTFLACGAALMLFVIPGIVLMIWFSMALPLVMLEDRAYGGALKRSFRLVRGSGWRVFFLSVVLTLLLAVIALAAVAPVQLAVRALSIPPLWAGAIHVVTDALVNTFTLPIRGIAWTILYLDLRLRREGADLAALAGQMLAPGSGPGGAGGPSTREFGGQDGGGQA